MNAFVIKDLTILKAALDFAKAIGVSVDPDNYDREIGAAISVGTSKNYVVAGNNKPSFYSEKKGLDLVPLTATTLPAFVSAVLSYHPVSTIKAVETLELDSESEVGIDDSGFNNDAIYLLVSKVKKMGKNPADYYVIDEDGYYGHYSLTTDADSYNKGNLQEIFDNINN